MPHVLPLSPLHFVAISNVSHRTTQQRRISGVTETLRQVTFFLHTAITGKACKLEFCLIQEDQKIHKPIEDPADTSAQVETHRGFISKETPCLFSRLQRFFIFSPFWTDETFTVFELITDV
ncbi:hypothetical protein AMECASPLE_020007 [Ameca splendens]|uniref:Uncharacterized protein n=1 Tax=Ameca splendens TaxID=208324 RepID=A0ABV0YEQ9_9TELE